MTELEKYYDDLGPCIVCGRKLKPDDIKVYTEEQASELNKIMERLKDSATGNSLAEMGSLLVCKHCMKLKYGERDRLAESRRLLENKMHVEKLGFLSSSAMECTFKNSNLDYENRNTEAWRRGRGWSIGHANLWIQGLEGTGKTWLSRCILSKHLADGRCVGELSAFDLYHMSRDWGDKQAKFIKKWTEPVLISLEDIDKPCWDKRSSQLLWELLDKRYDKKRNVLVTTNVSPEAFKVAINNAQPDNATFVSTLMARFLMSGKGCDRLTLEGESLRKIL